MSQNYQYNTIEEALRNLKEGKIVLVTDDPDRENEGDLILSLIHIYTVVGSAGSHLSGGERQRIAIARAMLKNAPVVILDEATSSVDPENEDELQRAIEALTHDKTSTHEIARYLKITEKAVYRCMDRLKEKVKKIFE